MDFNEKLISEFLNLGNVSRRDASAALQIYLDLCEVRRYWDVEYKYHEELKCLYFIAKKSKSETTSIFIPRASNDNLNFSLLQSYFTIGQDYDQSSIFLAIVSSDSTCVYYQISDGLHEPNDTSGKHSKINKQEKLDMEIRKHRNVITEAALCGTEVTIRDSKS